MTVAQRNFHRVSRSEKCRICGKPDWCMHSNDAKAVICTRVAEGSTRTINKNGNFVGYLHRLQHDSAPTPIRERPKTIETHQPIERAWQLIADDASDAADGERVRLLGRSLGLSVDALLALGIGWIGRESLARLDTKCSGEGCWTFPMFNADHFCIGIRLRTIDGFKYAITGSDGNGIFDPMAREPTHTLLIVEGPTSAGAMYDLGYSVIGRSSCTGSVQHCRKRAERRDVVIYADSDKPDERGRRPGRDGAEALARELRDHARTIKIMQATGEKDVRAMKQAGADRDLFDILISQATYWR